MTSGRALVIGEALVDVVAGVAHPGGSPLNVAVGLSRLGVTTTLHSSFGADEHGGLIARHLEASGVSVTEGTVGEEPTSIAEATVLDDGSARYRFDLMWRPAPVSADGFDLVHTGSIGAALEPGANVVEDALAEATGLVSFDPNIRPALMGEPDFARVRAERIVARAHIVKASDEDLRWLYPHARLETIQEHWLALGPRLVVVTRGAAGAEALTTERRHHQPARSTEVADTIGAGDSFMAGLLAAALEFGLDDPEPLLDFASACAAITVSRPGADPPRRGELG